MPLAPLAVEAPTATPAPSPPSAVTIQEATLVVVEVIVPASLAGSAVALSSTVVAPLLSSDVVTTSAPSFLFGSNDSSLYRIGDSFSFFVFSPSRLPGSLVHL